MQSLIDICDLSVEEVDELIRTAQDMIADPRKYEDVCRGKKLATLFYEPSTRTRLSFEAAMLELGGSVLGFSSASSSSAAKGESIADTARVLSCYADVIVMRTPVEGAPYLASRMATVPVINAGDGSHFHPTQTLADLLTIYREKGRLDRLTVGFCGDLRYGRTVHSLLSALSRYAGIRVVLVSPEELRLPAYVREEILAKNGMEYRETTDLDAALPDLDVLYMTRVQRERFADVSEYERLKDRYILTEEKMQKAPADMIVLHPLPRVNEISVRVDDDPRACYFKQVENGKQMRKALILKLLREREHDPVLRIPGGEPQEGTAVCPNPKCITAVEQEPRRLFRYGERNGEKICRCAYCDVEIV